MPKAKPGIDIPKFLRIERQPLLGAFDEVQKRHRNAAEEKHGHGVLRPAHFVLLIDASQPIHEPFDRAEEVNRGTSFRD